MDIISERETFQSDQTLGRMTFELMSEITSVLAGNHMTQLPKQ